MKNNILSLGLKKIVLPMISNSILKKNDIDSNINNIDERIERIEKLQNTKRHDMINDFLNTSNTHISPYVNKEESIAISCIACARSHLATVSASLKEAVRFARTEGIMNSEVQTRLSTAEEEIVALERYDWSPEKIIVSPEDEKEIIEKFLPQIRELRQQISTILILSDLVEAAAKAGRLHNDYRIAILENTLK